MDLEFHALDVHGVDILLTSQSVAASVPESALVRGSAPGPVVVLIEAEISDAG